MRNGYLKQNGVVCSPKCMFFAEYSLLTMFDTYPASKCTTQNIYVHARLCWFGSHSFTQDRARLPERRRKKMNNLRGRRFRFTTLETSVHRAKGIRDGQKTKWRLQCKY